MRPHRNFLNLQPPKVLSRGVADFEDSEGGTPLVDLQG